MCVLCVCRTAKRYSEDPIESSVVVTVVWRQKLGRCRLIDPSRLFVLSVPSQFPSPIAMVPACVCNLPAQCPPATPTSPSSSTANLQASATKRARTRAPISASHLFGRHEGRDLPLPGALGPLATGKLRHAESAKSCDLRHQPPPAIRTGHEPCH